MTFMPSIQISLSKCLICRKLFVFYNYHIVSVMWYVRGGDMYMYVLYMCQKLKKIFLIVVKKQIKLTAITIFK